jgi:glycosyltransferase involved in cell wall biosynthesis
MSGPPAVVLLVPGPLDTRTGGYGYDRRIVDGLRAEGWSVTVRELDATFPRPTPGAVDDARRAFRDIPDGSTVMVDGLALGALPDEAGRESGRLRLVAIVHHPLALETGLEPAVAAELFESERKALAAARAIVVTSRQTAATLAEYDVEPARITVIEPGTDRAALARGSGSSTVHLLCVAGVIPRKGHDVLLSALAALRHLDWRLTSVGSLSRHPPTVQSLRLQVAECLLSDRVTLVDEIDGDRLAPYYDAADVFVLATRYEGYGMVVAEALAHGLPVVATKTGAAAELVGAGAGILVTPGSVDELTRALGRVIADAAFRSNLAEGARRVRGRLPTWDEAAKKMAGLLERAANG